MKFNCGKDDLSFPKKKGGKGTQQQSYLRRSARNKSAFHNLDVSHVSGVYLELIGTIRSSNQILFRRSSRSSFRDGRGYMKRGGSKEGIKSEGVYSEREPDS